MRVSIVIVTFNSGEAVRESLTRVLEQLVPGDELVVVDNASSDGTPELVSSLAPGAQLILNSVNAGFAAAANAGAAATSGDLLVFLNPDAVPQEGFCEAIRRPLIEGRDWGAWMGLVTSDGGRVINSEGGVIHFTAIAWAGGAGRPIESGTGMEGREVAFASGACLAVPRPVWREHGGFAPDFFMYHEDVEFSLRLRLAGQRVGIEPAARVDHDYDFDKGPGKRFHLERNRWATIIRTYPAPLLIMLAPALLTTEAAMLTIAVAQGWGVQKLRASGAGIRALPRLLAERRAIQSRRRIPSAGFAAQLTADLDSSFLGRLAGSRLLCLVLRAYWRGVRVLIRGGDARA